MKVFLKILGLGVGVLLFVGVISQLGPEKILNVVLGMKGWFIPVLLNTLLWNLSYTAAWRSCFDNLAHTIPFLHLLKVKICGEAVNLMTPLGFIAGDPVRVLLLQKHLGSSTRFASVLVDRLINALATLSFVLTGIVVAFSKSVLFESPYRWGIVGIYIVVISALIFVIVELVRGKGLIRIQRFLVRHGFRRFHKMQDYLLRMNEDLQGFAGGGVKPLLKSFVFHLIGRVLGVFEIAIIFTYLTGAPHLILALMLTALTSMTHFIFSFIPGGFGIVETLYSRFFSYFSMDPVLGVSMQLIRRGRAFFWIGVGAILLNLNRKNA